MNVRLLSFRVSPIPSPMKEQITNPLLNRFWLPAMLIVEALPAFLALILSIGLFAKPSFGYYEWANFYFPIGVAVYISKILVSLHLITGKKARQVFITNGIYVVITILGISYMMLDEGFEWIGWFSLAYLLCSATLSFAAGIGNYKLLTR